ncbi:TetR family transcriptional regulator [Actinocorallia herbida]|uniref:TetR family transcriptional regulator n=1 Tax=Actinocorallia herbida TaxID=58109 RepID=A0A3N1D0M9_9ACTN|nr:TetR/AcrR family transcriptional regulator [Actinocorallia herbida]ROO86598.1 TetR family transcriptional regulator [Actinocorallia herbida]
MQTDAPRRRTQRERKEATVARLVDAAIAALAETGYAGTSLGEICARSGVSRGGLFRHFDSRLALLLAAAEEVARRHLAVVGERIAADPPADARAALALMRERHRAAENVVWFELMVAARTDPALHAGLAPIAERFHADIAAAARSIPALAALPDAVLTLLVTAARNHFDGEAISRTLTPDPVAEDAALAFLADYAAHVLTRLPERC